MTSDYPSRRSAVKTLVAGLGIPAVAHAASTEVAGSAHPSEVSVRHFGARGDGASDDTAAFERAIAAVSQDGRRLRIPAGRYRILRTLSINRGIQIEGDGVERSILLAGPGRSRPVIHIHAKETDSIIGPRLCGFKLICDQGAAPCDGIRLSTGGKGAAIHQAILRDLFIINTGTGIAVSGVVYRSCFDNITVSGSVGRYGFYCDEDFEDVTYNSFSNLEVTNVASGAYAYWIHSNYSNFLNLTADGCSYFSSPGGAIRNLAVEGVTAGTPPAKVVIQLNQMQVVEGVNLIAIDPMKCPYGIRVIGQAVAMSAIRCYTRQQPRWLFDLHPDSEGVITGVQTGEPATLLEDYLPATTLNRWVMQGAEAITRRQLAYEEGAWKPVFANWNPLPVVDIALWERVGRRVFVSLAARGGTPRSGATIGGFPIALPSLASICLHGGSGRHTVACRVGADQRTVFLPADISLDRESWNVELTFRA